MGSHRKKEGVRKDGSRRIGLYRILDEGKEFAHGEKKVQSYAVIYSDRVLSFKGDMIDIDEALGNRFSYNEIMNNADMEPADTRAISEPIEG